MNTVKKQHLEAELGVLPKADGSVKYSQGKTTVICAIYGPEASMKERGDKAVIEVNLQTRENKQIISGDNELNETIIRETLENIILTYLYPRTLISISLQVLIDDGNLFSTCLNASVLALLDAGVALNSIIVSSTCFIPSPSSKKDSSICFVFHANKLKEEQEQNDETESTSLLSCYSEGTFSEETFLNSLKESKENSLSIYHFMRMTLERKSLTPILSTLSQQDSSNKNVFMKPKE
ncbi:hypothetical protein ABK040_010120 [Willaertia magna]